MLLAPQSVDPFIVGVRKDVQESIAEGREIAPVPGRDAEAEALHERRKRAFFALGEIKSEIGRDDFVDVITVDVTESPVVPGIERMGILKEKIKEGQPDKGIQGIDREDRQSLFEGIFDFRAIGDESEPLIILFVGLHPEEGGVRPFALIERNPH